MANKDKTPVDVLSNLEQFESLITNFAPIVGSYYIALWTNGVPPELAAKLTVEWHNLFWVMHLNQREE